MLFILSASLSLSLLSFLFLGEKFDFLSTFVRVYRTVGVLRHRLRYVTKQITKQFNLISCNYKYESLKCSLEGIWFFLFLVALNYNYYGR